MMKFAAAVSLVLAVFPSTVNGQCASLCADGGEPGNPDGILPVPGGVGPITCELAQGLLDPQFDLLTPDQCTAAQAAAFLICECPTAPPPNLNLPCAFCSDGTLPTNPDAEIQPMVDISEVVDIEQIQGGQVGDCTGLVALASVVEDEAACADLIQTYSTVCGCPEVGQGVEQVTGTTDEPEEATSVVDEVTTGATADPVTTETDVEPVTTETEVDEGTTVVADEGTTVLPTEDAVETTEVDEDNTTVAVNDTNLDGEGPLVPTLSPAPSMAMDVNSDMPSSGPTGPTGSGATEPPSPPSLTPFPTDDDADFSAGYMAAKSTVCGAVLGMLVAISM